MAVRNHCNSQFERDDGYKQNGHANAGTDAAFERHFTPAELAEIWKFDESTIRRLFQDEPGVLKIGKWGRRDGKRDYVTLRIPMAVALRVYERRCR